MNKTLKEATVKCYYYESQSQLDGHLNTFVSAYNFAKLLKTLKGLTPYEFIVKTWAEAPELFLFDPAQFNFDLHNEAYVFSEIFIWVTSYPNA